MTTQEIKINIARLENTIKNHVGANGYLQNCIETLNWYKSLLN